MSLTSVHRPSPLDARQAEHDALDWARGTS